MTSSRASPSPRLPAPFLGLPSPRVGAASRRVPPAPAREPAPSQAGCIGRFSPSPSLSLPTPSLTPSPKRSVEMLPAWSSQLASLFFPHLISHFLFFSRKKSPTKQNKAPNANHTNGEERLDFCWSLPTRAVVRRRRGRGTEGASHSQYVLKAPIGGAGRAHLLGTARQTSRSGSSAPAALKSQTGWEILRTEEIRTPR